MNISASSPKMANFVDPSEYFFGIRNWQTVVEQAGIYNRAFWGVRVETVPSGTVEALNGYYESVMLQETIATQTGHFKAFATTANLHQMWSPFASSQTEISVGNCSIWTSLGLVWCGKLQRPRAWPKAVFLDLWEHEVQLDAANVNIVKCVE
jgi:hypothetical protein